MDMDFANGCPLVRPRLPHIRFLFVGSRFRSTLPSDGPSRFRPCASLVLHLHQVAQGTFTPRLPDMPGTPPALGRAKGPARGAGPDTGAGFINGCKFRVCQSFKYPPVALLWQFRGTF